MRRQTANKTNKFNQVKAMVESVPHVKRTGRRMQPTPMRGTREGFTDEEIIRPLELDLKEFSR